MLQHNPDDDAVVMAIRQVEVTVDTINQQIESLRSEVDGITKVGGVYRVTMVTPITGFSTITSNIQCSEGSQETATTSWWEVDSVNGTTW